ncbi:nuclear transport factor 2 family protein [Lysobacter sp. 1R34A]|uniref:nuclear transport factor 2 family protein n=1 Tax=Lysobacter sp. 1R34A TaxID=3445786 RepID=UPI003EEB1891
MKSIPNLCALALLALSLHAPAQTAPGAALQTSVPQGTDRHEQDRRAQARREIEAVVETFKAAIIAKDSATLKSLFLAEHNSWILVSSDEEFRQRRAKNPKLKKLEPGTYVEFAEQMSQGKERFEEKFSNVKIETDGAIASVHFDFVFLEDERITGKGQEAWQLVKTEQGWKINAVVYSSYPLK